MTMREGERGPELMLSPSVPHFEPTDTGRVLARYDGGQLSLSRFTDLYQQMDVVRRPSVNRPFALRAQLDLFVLEPFMAEIALQRGLDKDPAAAKPIELK